MTENKTASAKKRPTFITVLCILSFIGIGISIIVGILGIIGLEASYRMLSELGSSMWGDMPSIAMMRLSMILSLVLTGVSLAWVIMIWKLKKLGFYLYVGAAIIAIILPLFVIGKSSLNVFSVVVTAIFIILYGVNFKHLK